MKRMRRMLTIACVTIVVVIVGMQVWARTAPPPAHRGEVGDRLPPCPEPPNCTLGELSYEGSSSEAHAALVAVLEQLPRTTIVIDRPDYLAAESRSAFFGFVDDVEFLLDPATSSVQVRSASRLGRSDLGVNARRVEAIRRAFDERRRKTAS